MTFSGSRTVTLSTSCGPLMIWMCSGASPAVPSTSSWPSWPISRMSKSSLANRTASLVHLGHQRAGGVDGAQAAVLGGLDDGGRDAVGGEDHQGAFGDLVGFVDEDGALFLQGADHVDVVHDLLADVDGRAVVLQGLFHRDDGTVHAGAVAARGCQQDLLGAGDRAPPPELLPANAACAERMASEGRQRWRSCLHATGVRSVPPVCRPPATPDSQPTRRPAGAAARHDGCQRRSTGRSWPKHAATNSFLNRSATSLPLEVPARRRRRHR